jgi:hypothetical protein
MRPSGFKSPSLPAGAFLLLGSFLAANPPAALAAGQQIAITAAVAPKPSDVDLSFSASQPAGANLARGETVNFSIDYRSSLAGSEPIIIKARWNQGLIKGSTFNYIDIFEYVVGSAGGSADGTTPVIDPQNHTITWNIAQAAPAGHLSFKLKVRRQLPTEKQIDVTVGAEGKVFKTLLPTKSLAFTLQKPSLPGAPAATPPPTPSPSPLPSPAATEKPLAFDFISLQEVSDTSARLFFRTTGEAVSTVFYGENPPSLTEKLVSLNPQQTQTIKMTGLKPNHQYYFRIRAANGAGQTAVSDIFTFKTAAGEEIVSIKKDGVLFLWNKTILTSKETENLVVPQEKPLALSVKVENPENISQIKAKFQNTRVLGLNSRLPPPPIEETKLVEMSPGVFSSDLLAPQRTGHYQLVLEIKDVYGGFRLKNLPYHIIVSKPLVVLNRQTGEPVENARVRINKYEESSKTFVPLEEKLSFAQYTDENGELDLALPPGTYSFEAFAIGYQPVKEKSALGIEALSYPQILLPPSSSLHDKFLYYTQAVGDMTTLTGGYAASIFASQRARNVLLLALEVIVIFLVAVNVSLRVHLGMLGLPFLALLNLKRFLRKSVARFRGQRQNPYQAFQVYERGRTRKAVSGVLVYLLDSRDRLVWKGRTGLTGAFDLPVESLGRFSFPIKIFLHRKGYYAYPLVISSEALRSDPIRLYMIKDEPDLGSLRGLAAWTKDILLVLLSDLLVIYAFILSFFFIRYHGWEKSFFYVVTSTLIFVLWFVYIKKFWSFRRR